MIQLNPPIPLETSKGRGFAYFLMDYGKDYDVLWGVFIDKNKECWWVPNPEVRLIANWSFDHRTPHPILKEQKVCVAQTAKRRRRQKKQDKRFKQKSSVTSVSISQPKKKVGAKK